MQMQHCRARRRAGSLAHHHHGLREAVRLEIHGEQLGIARLRLKGDRARKPPGAQGIDRVGADMGAHIDEHGLGRQPPGIR